MNKICVILCFFLMAIASHAGEEADKQMEKFFGYLKKAKYKESAHSILDYVNMGDEQKEVRVANYAGHFENFIKQHGKALNYTTLRTRRLSKNFDETVYQINCEKSAWLVMIREYATPGGKSEFSELGIFTEDDVFKYYEKK